MIPEWKTIREHGIPENGRTVVFFDQYDTQCIGFFKLHSKGEYVGSVFVESRRRNESNGMFGSYVNHWNTVRDKDNTAALEQYIKKWDYLPTE
jgi:hypothetical protein